MILKPLNNAHGQPGDGTLILLRSYVCFDLTLLMSGLVFALEVTFAFLPVQTVSPPKSPAEIPAGAAGGCNWETCHCVM